MKGSPSPQLICNTSGTGTFEILGIVFRPRKAWKTAELLPFPCVRKKKTKRIYRIFINKFGILLADKDSQRICYLLPIQTTSAP